MGFSNFLKRKIKTWLNIREADNYTFNIRQSYDFEGNAFQNLMWYRGKSDELYNFYSQMPANPSMFWAKSTYDVRHIHSGLPHILVDILAKIVVRDMNDIEFKSMDKKDLWDTLASSKENDFKMLLKNAVSKALVIGDGCFKISLDSTLSDYPIIEFYSGELVDIRYKRGRYFESEFRKVLTINGKTYYLFETYGYGYINYTLCNSEQNEIDIKTLDETKNLVNVVFDNSVNLAIPFIIYKSASYEGRGSSIYDSKIDNFDALDECISQWCEAVRKGRAKKYIPECFLMRDPDTGEVIGSNDFNDDYMAIDSGSKESDKNEIKLIQPVIPTDNYLQTYMTLLDLCLQGIISPSTLGIDTKKLDNAEAQREKEKTTLYTRNDIIESLSNVIPNLVDTVFKCMNIANGQPLEDVECNVVFGEYATPSFEAQVETIGKAKTQGIMSVDACIEELYGDSKSDEWKQEEVARIKEESGLVNLNEPSVNVDAGEYDSRENDTKENEPDLNDTFNTTDNDKSVDEVNEIIKSSDK